MSLETFAAISLGAVLGANARYLLGGWFSERLGAGFPWATLVVNASGSLAIGFLLTIVIDRGAGPWWARPAIAIGFLGSYTTFSTFSWETLQLFESGAWLQGAANVISSVLISLGAALGGIVVARLL